MGRAEGPLRRLGSALGAAQDARFRALAVPRDPARLMSEVVRRDSRRRAAARGTALVFALALTLFLLVRPRPLSFEVAGVGPGRVGAWIRAEAEPLPLSFSDGTVVTLASEARARIVALEHGGARLVLEQGALSAHVVHRDDTQWAVVAGPFEVRVTGTRFDVVWSPAADVFELRLREGAVTVTGPSLGNGRNLRAGEALHIDAHEPARGHADSVAPVGQAPDAGAPSATAPLPSVPSANVQPSALPASKARATSARQRVLKTLRELASAGNYPELVRVAQGNDLAALCREANIDDLMLLADAARLSGAAEPARDALLSLRDRFSRDPRAATAAFLLGRIFFEQLNEPARAARWFAVYLDEQPNGELADDALSRLAEARELSGDHAGARQAARRYLVRNPKGPQAERAKRLAD